MSIESLDFDYNNYIESISHSQNVERVDENTKKLENLTSTAPTSFNVGTGRTKEEVQLQYLNLDKMAKEMLKRTHLVFASSMAGKTTYIVYLIYYMMLAHPTKNFYIYNLSLTLDSKIKLKVIIKMYEELKKRSPKFTGTIKLMYETEFKKLESFFDSVVKRSGSKLVLDGKQYETIVYIDDMSDQLTNTANDAFFKKFSSIQRHYDITTILSTHSFKRMPDAIRNQIHTLSILGKHTDTNCKVLHENNTLTGYVFQKYTHLIDFFKSFCQKYLDKHTVMCFMKEQEICYLFKVPIVFINKLKEEQALAEQAEFVH